MAFKAPERVCPYHPTESTHVNQLRCNRCNRTLYNVGPRADSAQIEIEARRRAHRASPGVSE